MDDIRFRFRGEIPGSKSVFNRALIVKSYFPELQLKGFSECDDVKYMFEGIKQINDKSRIDCGEGGTTFRFLALRVSRQKGNHILEGSERLLSRPQKGLLALLNQLGVEAEIHDHELKLKSLGWKKPGNTIRVDSSESSQYASALLLNSWLLDFDLEFELTEDKVSEAYFLLTLEMVQEMGLKVNKTKKGYHVPAFQKVSLDKYSVEPDISSTFTMASAAALAGELVVENFPEKSKQPDLIFLEIFKKMGIRFSVQGTTLTVSSTPHFKNIEWNLSESPDLFPVLAILCSWADGISKLYGAPHLTKKESNRISKVADLLSLLKIKFDVLPDGMVIQGNPSQQLMKSIRFNPDSDHRMVMAATLMKLKGHDIVIEEPQAINKSFPEFWNMLGIKP
ncbi:MAG: 3-phosphoshikimate 1-carboxyvinyltransferase [Bdellovibrio sp.]